MYLPLHLKIYDSKALRERKFRQNTCCYSCYLLFRYIYVVSPENYRMAMISEAEPLSGTQGFKTRQVTIPHMVIWVYLVSARSSPAILFWPFSHYLGVFVFFTQRKVCSLCVCFLVPISVKIHENFAREISGESFGNAPNSPRRLLQPVLC